MGRILKRNWNIHRKTIYLKNTEHWRQLFFANRENIKRVTLKNKHLEKYNNYNILFIKKPCLFSRLYISTYIYAYRKHNSKFYRQKKLRLLFI